jgi:hypothetical protein
MATQQPQKRPQSSQQRQRATRGTTKSSGGARPFNMPFESKNIIFILVGIAVITLGYYLMGSDDVMGSMALNISPMILIIGYLIVIPLGIMYGSRTFKKTDGPATPTNPSSNA